MDAADRVGAEGGGGGAEEDVVVGPRVLARAPRPPWAPRASRSSSACDPPAEKEYR